MNNLEVIKDIKENKSKIKELENSLNNMELTSSNITRPNGETLEESFSSLKNKVDDGQNHKICEDNGTAILLPAEYDLDNLKNIGIYNGNNLVNAPSSDWWYIEVMQHTNLNGYVYQRATSLSNHVNIDKFERQMIGGTWGDWREL